MTRPPMTTLHIVQHQSPVGPLTLIARGAALVGLRFDGDDAPLPAASAGPSPTLDAARRQLDDYFAGRLEVFDLPLEAEGTAFQKKVWAALRQIPYGVTVSYGDIARKISSPAAVRAVGAANGRNPIAIVVPCHRVIGGDGSLTGFGGGLERKKFLLTLERRSDTGTFSLTPHHQGVR